jgi:hypothetical protein
MTTQRPIWSLPPLERRAKQIPIRYSSPSPLQSPHTQKHLYCRPHSVRWPIPYKGYSGQVFDKHYPGCNDHGTDKSNTRIYVTARLILRLVNGSAAASSMSISLLFRCFLDIGIPFPGLR